MDSVESDEIAVNFERVLNGLLQQNYNVTSDVYFDMFIKHLSSKDASGVGTANFWFCLLNCSLFTISLFFQIDYSVLLQRPLVLTWMEQSVKKIVTERKNVAAFTFTCRLLALLTEHAEQFVKLNQQNIFSE